MNIRFDPCVIRVKGRLSIAGSYLKTLEDSLPHANKTAIIELKAKAKAESWDAEEYFIDEDILDHDFEEIPVMAGNAFITGDDKVDESVTFSSAVDSVSRHPIVASEIPG
jgi:hypothetical protein